MIYLVAYDLNQQGQKYKELTDELNKLGKARIRPQKSLWFIDTEKLNAEKIYNAVKKHLDNNDRIFICPVSQDNFGFLEEDHWKWLNARS